MRKTILAIMLATATTAIYAQSNDNLLKESRRLYAEREYSALLGTIEKIDIKNLNTLERQEIELLRAKATFAADHLEGRALLLQYLADYPESTYRSTVAALIAESYYYAHNFELARKWFDETDFERLDTFERERAELCYALTLQECGESEKARNTLAALCLTSEKYAEDAQFHLAVMQYHADELSLAYEGLKKVEMTDKYYLEVPYYIAGIYVKEGKFEQALRTAAPFIADHSDKRQGVAMKQMEGAALYSLGRYADAITPLEEYIAATDPDKHQRIARYQLAICYFETGDTEKAAMWFNECIGAEDAITQNAYLHQGMIHIKEQNMNAARMAFERAANMDCDNRLREEALYNYALCIHSTRYSPFAESVKTFERFLNEYPESPHCDQVNKYLVEVYMNTRNYDVALQSIEKITAPSPLILTAKQKVLYRLGVQAYIDSDLNKAISFFNRSIELSKYDKSTYSDALYWRGEAYYDKGDYATAAGNYKSAISFGDHNNDKATYGLAYTYFQRGDISNAKKEFTRFLGSANNDKELLADACNRIGDCYFYSRDYRSAESYYQKAAETHRNNSDYALYRIAIAQGLRKDYNAKTTTLTRLIADHPESNHIQQAYYEKGRAYIELEENRKAIVAFEQLIQKYPHSDLTRVASVERAMLLNSIGDNTKAIDAYKDIIARYPHSEEAHTAAQDLKNIYVEQGDVDEYARYAANTAGVKAVESSEIDTLTFFAAEKIYSRGATDAAAIKFEEYLSKFPEGSFTLDSHYYLGVIYYNAEQSNKAVTHFEKVTAFPDNKYSEEAMAHASEIYYRNKQWQKAMELYAKLIEKSSDTQRKAACRVNLLRCAYNLGDASVTTIAREILAKDAPSPEEKREVQYYLAKSLLNENNAEAEKILAELARDTRTIYGAEAKFLLAQYMYEKGRYSECEKEIFEYIDESTPHAYWLARSFVLLADLYSAQGRNEEAKQYLLSLQSNYTADDNIKDIIADRLNKLSVKE